MPKKTFKDGYIVANGIKYYYQIHGEGEPLLLLHGGLGQIEMFGDVLTRLSKTREVIAVDLHGHGRTALGDRPIHLPDMGDDMAVILKELGYTQVDLFGYSLGGGVALRLALQHPDVVRRMVVMSAGFSTDGFYADIRVQQAQVNAGALEFMKKTPMYTSYVAIAPHPEDFPRLLDAIGDYMKKESDWSEEIKTLKTQTMLVYGDSDMFRPEHMVEFYQLLGGGLKDAGWMRENMSKNRLAILPDSTHYDILNYPLLTEVVLQFLDAGNK